MKNSNLNHNEIEVSISAEQIEAAMTPKQKEALDKNKDGKVSKEDFEMLRKSRVWIRSNMIKLTRKNSSKTLKKKS